MVIWEEDAGDDMHTFLLKTGLIAWILLYKFYQMKTRAYHGIFRINFFSSSKLEV